MNKFSEQILLFVCGNSNNTTFAHIFQPQDIGLKEGVEHNLERWAFKLRIRMLENQINECDVAKRMGISKQYFSMILNGHCEIVDAKKRISTAIDEIIKERKQKG